MPMSLLLENIGKLKPRVDSIFFSLLQSRKTISITAVVESQRNEAEPHEFKDVATNYLLAHHLSDWASIPWCRSDFLFKLDV